MNSDMVFQYQPEPKKVFNKPFSLNAAFYYGSHENFYHVIQTLFRPDLPADAVGYSNGRL